MGEQFFDELAKGLDDGTLSRRRALKLAGGALLAAVVPTAFSREAEAANRAKRRCRRRGGVYVSRGDCRCAITCPPNYDEFTCHSNPDCSCIKTVTGRGFCAHITAQHLAGCSTSANCPAGEECVVIPGCPGSGGTCTTSADCSAAGLGFACVNGTCQFTGCHSPCPT